MMRSTKRDRRQARAIPVRGKRLPTPGSRLLRASSSARVPRPARPASPRSCWSLRRRPTNRSARIADGCGAGQPAGAPDPRRGTAARAGAPPARAQRPAYARPSAGRRRGARSRRRSTPRASVPRRLRRHLRRGARRPARVGRQQRGRPRRAQPADSPAARWSSAASRRPSWRPRSSSWSTEGRLGLDDPVRQHPARAAPGQPRDHGPQLLDHTSGLADVFNDTTRVGPRAAPGARRGPPTRSSARSTRRGTSRARAGRTPTRTTTCSASIVERVTGSTLDGELDRRFLDAARARARRASLTADEPNEPLAPAWTTIFWASGAMSSSAADLARWGDALYGDDVADVALEQHVRAMLDVNDDDYGLGVAAHRDLAASRLRAHRPAEHVHRRCCCTCPATTSRSRCS